MKAIRFALFLAFVAAAAGPARAVGIALAPPVLGPGSQIEFTVVLDAPTSINGYDLTIAWDPGELSFLSATELTGLGFDDAPPLVGADPAGERVAAFELTAVSASDLFSVLFDVLPGALADGDSDFSVFVAPANGSGLIPGAIDDPAGIGYDVVPEPCTGALLGLGLIALASRRSRRKAG
jgi:hypothetical protein